MKNYILAGAAALALALPAAAQTTGATDSGTAYSMNTTQRASFDTWPPDRRTVYETWPRNYQEYFWTLSPAQQTGWWVLTDDQRAKVYAMTPEQRTQAWNAIAAQMAGGTPSMNASATAQTATTAAGMASTAGPRWVSNAVVQNVSADAPAANPPICGPNMYDNCINAWEAGKRGPNVTKPLDHWPGKPASEM